MSTFLGIGLGPIQTGIFLYGAGKGGFDNLFIAEVDETVKDAVNQSGGVIRINIAASDRVYTEEMKGVKVLNPLNKNDANQLIDIAADADEIATALPSVSIFPSVAEWLRQGFTRKPDKERYIYTAENNNHAAELLAQAVNSELPETYYLNTVVGKMSGVVAGTDCETRKLITLCDKCDRAHLVEEFNRILISKAPGIENRKTQGLFEKENLYPFEEAKLYGHNAIHFLLGIMGRQTGATYMSELAENKELMDFVNKAFIEESGEALCRKWNGVDELFTPDGFRHYADDLLLRMTNPFLQDTIERITRDPARKLSWNDRVIGTMRLALSQQVTPTRIARGAALAAIEQFGNDPQNISNGLKKLWDEKWDNEHQAIISLILEALKKLS